LKQLALVLLQDEANAFERVFGLRIAPVCCLDILNAFQIERTARRYQGNRLSLDNAFDIIFLNSLSFMQILDKM
jgi:hypothetical protein